MDHTSDTSHNVEAADGICRYDCTSERVGISCPLCGHTNFVHPSAGNPSLTACVICELLAMKS